MTNMKSRPPNRYTICRTLESSATAVACGTVDFVASWSSGVDKMEGQAIGMVGTPAGDTGTAVSWEFATGKTSPKL